MDDYGGGRMAARELLRRGYRHPAAMFKTDDLQGKERARGFRDELAAHGIFPAEEDLLTFGTEERMTLLDLPRGQRFLDRLAARQGIDSLVCHNDVFAMHLMDGLKHRGLRLPEDLGVIGFDNAPLSGMTRPALTTLGHPQEGFGALAAEKLFRMIDGSREQNEEIPWVLVERASLRPEDGE